MRRSRSFLTGAVILIVLAVLAVFGPLLLPDPNLPDYTAKLLPPGSGHLLGTDQMGRDVAARITWGARVTLASVAAVWVVAVGVGLGLGVISALTGRVLGELVARATDLALALPQVIVALAIAGAVGGGMWTLVAAMSATAWAATARLSHAYLRDGPRRADVIAARMAGVTPLRALLRHALPAAAARVVSVATLGVGQLILTLAGLSFLGLGASPPTAEWGRMLADSRHDIMLAPWLIIAPTTAIFAAVTGAALLADGMKRTIDEGADR